MDSIVPNTNSITPLTQTTQLNQTHQQSTLTPAQYNLTPPTTTVTSSLPPTLSVHPVQLLTQQSNQTPKWSGPEKITITSINSRGTKSTLNHPVIISSREVRTSSEPWSLRQRYHLLVK